MNNKRIFSILIMLAMLLITINGASATSDENISDIGDNWLRKLANGHLVTYNDAADKIICIDENGVYEEIDTTPYDAEFMVRLAGTPAAGGFLDENALIYVCNTSGRTLCIARCSAGTFNTEDISPVYKEYSMNYVTSIPAAYTPPNETTVHVFSYDVNAFGQIALWYTNHNFDNNVTWTTGTPMCSGAMKHGEATDVACSDNYWATSGGNLILRKFTGIFDRAGMSQSGFFIAKEYYINSTHFTINNSASHTMYFPNQQNDHIDGHSFCWEDTSHYWCRGWGSNSLAKIPKNDMPSTVFNNSFTRQGDTFNALFYEKEGTYELFNVNNQWRHYNNGLLTHTGVNITANPYYNQFFFSSLFGDKILYILNTTHKRLLEPAALIGNGTNDTVNDTYINVSWLAELGFASDADLTTMHIVDDNGLLIGGFNNNDEVLIKVDTTNITNPTGVALEDITPPIPNLFGDNIFSIDYSNGNVFVGTYDETNILSGYSTNNFTSIYQDGYFGGWHLDKIKDIVAKTNSTGYLCDNNDEMDYYVVGNDPTGNTGGGCYDIEYDGSDVAYVDSDTNGILSWNVSDINPNNWVNLDTYAVRTASHGKSYGDILDLKDDVLLSIKSTYVFTAINISDPSSIIKITECNSGGAGIVSSVEIINDTLAIAGTTNGRILICDLTNTDETTNTDWYTISAANETEIVAIEYNNGITHMLTPKLYIAYNLTYEMSTENVEPTLANYTLSDTEVLINEPIDVTMTAGDVEPEDVIYYGIKCNDTENNFTFNTIGEHTCTYNASGVYNIVLAVTDNFHYPTWYDETSIEIVVLEDVFTGGILRIQVIDENSLAIVSAGVQANNESKNTNILGLVTFTTPDQGLYEVTTTKTDYFTSIDNFYADGATHVVTLFSSEDGDITRLIVTVTDTEGSPLENVLVSYTNTITYEYNYDFSDALGKTYFNNIGIGSVIINTQLSEYESTSGNTVISSNTTNYFTIKMDGEGVVGIMHDDRDCIDNGLWLCGKTVDHACTVDSDCLGDFCDVSGTCSRFNFSVCDANDYPRGQRCIYKFTLESWFDGIVDWFFSNLVIVGVLIIILVAFGYVVMAWKSPK